MVAMPKRASRCSIRSPMPGMSRSVSLSSGAGMSFGCQTMLPFGLPALHAILAS